MKNIEMISLEFRITDTNSESPRLIHNRNWFTVVAVIHRNPDQEGSGAATNAAHRFPAFREKTIVSKRMPRHHSECPSLVTKTHPTKTYKIEIAQNTDGFQRNIYI